jgi:hypothetical protein
MLQKLLKQVQFHRHELQNRRFNHVIILILVKFSPQVVWPNLRGAWSMNYKAWRRLLMAKYFGNVASQSIVVVFILPITSQIVVDDTVR